MKRISKQGIILIISGPSGTGKSTVCRALLERCGNLTFSISCTTRAPRPQEVDGKDYYFVSQKEFLELVDKGEFLEYALVHDYYYGTLRSEVLDRINKGMDVLLDIDVQGVDKMKTQAENDSLLAPCIEFVFVTPPDFKELERRLRGRGTETEAIIQKRLNNARKELRLWRNYDYLIINDNLETTINELEDFIQIMHNSTKRIKDFEFYE